MPDLGTLALQSLFGGVVIFLVILAIGWLGRR